MIILGGVSVWNVFVVKSYFTENIPSEPLKQLKLMAAVNFVSGTLFYPCQTNHCGDGSFHAVGHWNSYLMP